MLKLLALLVAQALALALLASASAQSLQPKFPYNKCGGSILGEVMNASITPACDTQCTLQRDSIVEFVIKFLSYAATSRPKLRVTINIGGIPSTLPLTAEEENVCNWLTTGSCPITAGPEYTMTYRLKIESNLPAAKITMTLEIYDSASVKNIACISFPAVIT